MKNAIKNALRAAYDFRSWRSKRKLLVIESDDWGAVRMPNKETLQALPAEFIKYYDSPYYRYDTLANSDDLLALFEVLNKHRDRIGNPAVFTANSIMVNPDFKAIINSGYREYYFQNFRETLKEYYREDVWELWQQGMSERLFHPQLHGREHVDVSRWMKLLKEGNMVYRDAIQRGIYAVDFAIGKTKRNLTAALDIEKSSDINPKLEALKEAVANFKNIFGYQPLSFIAPSYTWNSKVERTLKEEGVIYLQGIRNQKLPQIGVEASYTYRRHYLGERNNLGQIYLIRNVFFEPTLNPDINVLKDAISRINWAFRFGQPAIVGSHRVNYIGAINPKNRDRNLKLLDQLLGLVKKKWPEVEFVTSDQLGELINAN